MSSSLFALTLAGFAADIGRSLKESFFMFFATFWALVLGFGLSGAVQAFVPRTSIQRHLGNHGPAAITRASLFGMASSSCSYAASAMAKSLFQKGADFVSSMVFMFASTNLVVELGIVLVVLIGWQFMAAEFVGGLIMIALLALFGGLVFTGRALDEARDKVAVDAPTLGSLTTDETAVTARSRLRQRSSWTEAARYTIADLQMLRREMVIGYVVAGFLAVLVPTHIWSDAFLTGHGNWTTIENVIVGPFIAIISFVCSIGNVPLAAALWKGGISFGGVVSFIFADLIAMPLLLVYRKLYGKHMTLRMLALFWTIMSNAGLVTEIIFRTAGLVPQIRTATIVPEHFGLGATTLLDLGFFALFVGLIALSRTKDAPGVAATTAVDPVCGMQVQIANAPASYAWGDRMVYFCSDHCKERFVAAPERYAIDAAPSSAPQPEVVSVGLGATRHGSRTQLGGSMEQDERATSVSVTDPVCHMEFDIADAATTRVVGTTTYFFCCDACAAAFDASPEQYLSE